jgi:hypothetical protein
LGSPASAPPPPPPKRRFRKDIADLQQQSSRIANAMRDDFQ